MLPVNKNNYFKLYDKIHQQLIDKAKNQYKRDNNYIYSYFTNEWYKYKINDILKLFRFYNEFKSYIYSLKTGDLINKNSYGLNKQVKIIRVNYKRKNKNIISSFTVKAKHSSYKYGDNIKKSCIVYNGVKFKNLIDVCKHFYSYMFFTIYDIENADKILNKLNNGGV